MLKGLRQFNTQNSDLDRLFQNVARFAAQFTNKPVLDGLLLDSITLTSGSPTTISHGLGRDIQGWIVTGINANANIWALAANQSGPSRTLVLNTSANCVASLYVF